MSQINVNRIKDSNEGAPDFPSGVNVSGVTSTVTLGVTNLNTTNLNVLGGVCTATTFDGSLPAAGTPTLGLGVTINASGVNISGVATAGIVSATTLYGNGANITGIALSIAPLNYNPSINDMKVTEATGIGFTFNQGVKAGSGNVTLSLVSVGSTLVENFSVGSSVTYGDSDYGTTVTISPTSSLDQNTVYALSYPSGAFTNLGGDLDYVGTAYTFKTILQNYTMWSWGRASGGQLGLNGSVNAHKSSPTQIPGTNWSDIGGVKSDGTLWAWGWGGKGNLGQNSGTNYSSPVQVGSDTTWKFHFNRHNTTHAIKTNGTLWSWGYNNTGRLGLNNTTNYSSPVQIPGTTWPTSNDNKFAHNQGGISAAAIKTDGTLWTWGSYNEGSLGQNSNVHYSSPVQIYGGGTTWKCIADGMSNGFAATKTDGTLWVWGKAGDGALGLNEPGNSHRSSPTQVPGTTWDIVTSSSDSSLFATKTDGTLWSWGANGNNYGTLGLGDNTNRSSPTQIGSGTDWSKPVTNCKQTGAALKTDGTLWAWGSGAYGSIGNNSVDSGPNSPFQIPGTNWVDLKGDYDYHVRAIQLLEE
jgi:alpha-tubulin suppressor-like RCC1 family protein